MSIYLLFSLVVLWSTPALAQEAPADNEAVASEAIDVQTLPCTSLTALAQEEGNEESTGFLLFWMDGYQSGKSGNTQVNFDALLAFAEQLTVFCAANPEIKLLDAAQQVGAESGR